jgi:Low-density lipoprotein receptor repeat class B
MLPGVRMKKALYSGRNAGVATLALLVAMALAPVGAQAKVYFSAFLAQGGTGIERSAFDGSALETLQFEPTGFADDLALDTLDGKMYWTDTNASVIWSANLNGTDAQIVLDDFGQQPLGIALDVANGKMYWTDAEGVKRAALDGAKPELLAKAPARGFIALDLVAQQMYWADLASGDIKTAPMTVEPTVTNVISKQSCPFGIAVDHAGGKLYWLELEINELNEKKKCKKEDAILRANLDGSDVQPLLERPGAGLEGGLAIDPAAGKLYWSETAAHDIGVSSLDGSQPQTLLSTGEDSPEGLAVDTADPHPANTTAPVVEGNAQVGSPLSCNPGTWTGTGPLFFGYQWAIVGATAIEGASASTYVPSAEQAGIMLVCVVTAADNVETSVATSAAVAVAPFPSGPPPPSLTVVHTRLIAGIALARLTGAGTRARIPVFTSLAGIATLKATPIHKSHKRAPRSRSKRAVQPKPITVTESLRAGRTTITLKRLVPGTAYRLLLTIRSADGQVTRDTATLRLVSR